MTLEREKVGHCQRIVLRHVLRGSNLGYVSPMPTPIDALADLADEALYSTPAVCRIAQVTFRQLDYWTRTGTIVPETPAHGSGSQRRFTGAQVRDVAMAGRLRELGVSLDAIEEVLRVVHDAEGALIVVAPEFVRAVTPGEVGQALADANGAAIIVSPDSLGLLSREPERCVTRGKAPTTGRRPARAARFRP